MMSAQEPVQHDDARLLKRLDRERRARLEAEAISERVTLALYRERIELELLQKITTAANQASTNEDVLQTTLDEVCAYLAWPVGHACLFAEDDTGDLIPVALCHLADAARFEIFRKIIGTLRLSPGVGLPGRVLASRKPVWSVDVTKDERFVRDSDAIETGMRAGFAFPVLIGTEVVAVLEFYTDRPVDKDESLLTRMMQIGTQVGRVIERRRAAEKLQVQFKRLHLLNQINQAITGWQDMESLVHVVLRHLEDHLETDFGSVYVFDPVNDTLTVATYRHRNREPGEETMMAKGTVITVQQSGLRAVVEGQTAYLRDTARAGTRLSDWLAQAGLGSAVATPLIAASEQFGVLLIARQKPNAFSSGECEFLRMLSTHVAVAVHQTRMHANLKNAYDELRQTQQAVMQQERLRALGQLASGLAHDINNALSPVMGYAELLLERTTDPDTQKDLGRIKTAAEDISHIITRLREFYRHREESDGLSALQLNDLAQEVIEITRPRWRDIQQERGGAIRIGRDLAPALPEVTGCASELREALINLVLNAADAMPHGGTLSVRTRVHTHREAGVGRPSAHRIIIEICDTGTGMNDEARRRCLEPFFTTKGERGTGLGLAMVFGVMARHDGEIEIESEPGRGTTMRLIFPHRESLRAMSALPVPAAQTPAPSLRILYIDDEPLLRELLIHLIESCGHRAQVAADGESGVEMFQRAQNERKPFDIVVTDLGMPYMDGRQVALAVKSESPTTPVILLTGWGSMLKDSEDRVPHVDCILSKPPRLGEIRETLLRLHRERSA